MKILKIDKVNADKIVLQHAAKILAAGGVIIHPTETVYGLAAVWNRTEALEKIAKLKGREMSRPSSIMVSSVAEMLEISGNEDSRLRYLLAALFPAPLTTLIKRRMLQPLPYWNRFEYLGFRLPAHELSLNLVEETGCPLITTSANLTGENPAQTVDEIPREIKRRIDLVLDGGACIYKTPSTVVKITSEPPGYEILRKGAYPVEKFIKMFEKYFL
ncbi:MAG: L-threonylcarbamoyladenylate synthase [Calditrichia bacterium]